MSGVQHRGLALQECRPLSSRTVPIHPAPNQTQSSLGKQPKPVPATSPGPQATIIRHQDTGPHTIPWSVQQPPGWARGRGRAALGRKVIMSGLSERRSMGPRKEVACERVSSAAHYRHGIDSSIVIRRHACHVKSCPLKCIRQGLLPPFPRALLAANNLPRAF